ncbi:MAG TPA: DUF6600 domain-containing protein [Candidatus Methylomirabilis sp.]|nr:DUF6600 domain-containing protein [Candidatus Methylomirabilis sp.]
MKRYALRLAAFLSMALALSFVVPQRAAADDDDDPPGRVARLGYVRGNVSFEPAGTDDWVAAVVNRPLTTGDKLWNDADSFSELHLGTAFIRLGSNTGFSFLNLTDDMAQIRLTEGTLNIRVRRLGDNETFEVDTPNLAFTVLRPGNYKINVNEEGDTTLVIVRDGQGEVTGGGSAYTIHPGEVGTFNGTDQINADVEQWDNSTDDFDNWCDERDHRTDHSVSARYVSDDVIGYEDLDEYGGWRPTPDYGQVWFPHVTIVGWAPYHYGHWVYIAPWGYTWVDDAPWGFAPFHYGRWVVVGGVWGWVPAPPRPVVVGAVYVRPVYAPALVAWVGGPHFGVGVAVGGGVGVNVGWFPLGPREVYVPSYHVSRTYVNNINVSNTTVNTTVVNNYYNTTVINHTTVNNVTYVNQRVPGAVTAVSTTTFTSAQPVARNVVAVNVREVSTAPAVYNAPAVAPSRQAVLGAGAVARVRPPAVLQTRAVVAKSTPPPPPVTFARQQEMIQANGGRPVAVSAIRQAQPQNEMVRAGVKIAPAATPQNIQANRGGQPNSNRPVTPNNAAVNPANNNANRPNNPAVTNANAKNYNDRPQANRPNTVTNETLENRQAQQQRQQQLEQQHQQQLQTLRSQQDLERQKLEQQQQQDRANLAKKAADDQAQQRLNQQHQQQLENLERKHDTQQNQLQQKQLQQDRKVEQAPPKPPSNNKPPKEEKKPHK